MTKLLALLALTIAPCFAQITNVIGTLYLPDGTKYNGQISCQWPVPFIGGDGRIMPAGPPVTTSVRNGALSINLEANDTASPANTSYTCTYRPTGSSAISEIWIVTYSAMPVNLSSVRQPQPAPTPTISINPSQLTQDGATTGQVLGWGVSSWGPVTAGTVSSIATGNGLTGGPITGSGTISGVNAAADGTTKGVAAFTANDFNASSGVISLDYTNGQKATNSLPGFLSSADWSTFNSKLSSVACANLPALTGDTTSSAGSCATIVTRINGTLLSGLATGLLKNTTATGVPSIAVAADVYGLWSGSCSSATFLRGDGACVTPSGAVTSVFSRTGVVTAQSGDYTASQVTNAASTNATNTFTGRQDATGAASTSPAKSGTSLPATCTVDDLYYKSDATAGQNIYGCTATNTWTQQGGAVASVFSRTGVVTAQSGDYTVAQVTNAVANNAANTYSGGGLQDFSGMKVKPGATTVGSLPSAASNANVVYLVTDGTSATDCSVGSGSTRAWCVSTGSAWATLASSASAGVDSYNTRTGVVTSQSGDYTAAQVTNAFDITAVNTLTNAAAPSSPSAGSTKVYADSTNKVLSAKNDGGTVSHTVQTIDCSSGSQLIQKINGDGSGTCASPATSGAMFSPANNQSATSSNWQNLSILAAIRGESLSAFPTSWKIRMRFTSGSPVIGAMKILRTLAHDTTVIDSTNVQISGNSAPTLTTPATVTTDAISLATDSTHDYWFVIFFTNTGANASVALAAQGPVNLTTGFAAGDQTAAGTIPALTSTNSPYLVLGSVF